MTRDEVFRSVQEIFRDIFDVDDLIIDDLTNSDDIEDWDSLNHINLVSAIEKEFKIRFALGELIEIKLADQGKEFTQAFTTAKNVIGSTRAMTTKKPALFSIQALNDCVITSFNWSDFIEKMSQDTEFLKWYVNFLETIFIKKEER